MIRCTIFDIKEYVVLFTKHFEPVKNQWQWNCVKKGQLTHLCQRLCNITLGFKHFGHKFVLTKKLLSYTTMNAEKNCKGSLVEQKIDNKLWVHKIKSKHSYEMNVFHI